VKLLQIKLANTDYKLKDRTIIITAKIFYFKYFAKAVFCLLCYS